MFDASISGWAKTTNLEFTGKEPCLAAVGAVAPVFGAGAAAVAAAEPARATPAAAMAKAAICPRDGSLIV